jgi:Nif-specific regulatory protein
MTHPRNGKRERVDPFDRASDEPMTESAVLESLASILTGPEASADKIERAVSIVMRRLQALRPPAAEERRSTEPTHEREQESPAGLVGDSPAMKAVCDALARVSHSQATVLLRGESGTGKELVARAIHRQGPRADKPFVPLHCAAVSETLLESELFGHERGAFTGAVESRKGRFELADGGTLFLDEIGDIPLGTQVKLLRVLQEKCFERVGGRRPLSVDVRIISATHRDLEAMVRAGTFREDLYYRLNVVPIILPPLRERRDDVPLLIDYFLSRFNRENRRSVRLEHDLRSLMARYHWPGNVRELQNCLERLVVMADAHQSEMTVETIPPSLRRYFADMRQVTRMEPPSRVEAEAAREEPPPLGVRLQEIERSRLLEALVRAGWVQAKAARVLGLTPRQVAYKMRKYGISEGGQ